jgi:hypothetical protein
MSPTCDRDALSSYINGGSGLTKSPSHDGSGTELQERDVTACFFFASKFNSLDQLPPLKNPAITLCVCPASRYAVANFHSDGIALPEHVRQVEAELRAQLVQANVLVESPDSPPARAMWLPFTRAAPCKSRQPSWAMPNLHTNELLIALPAAL